jgi:hypothetical protein
LSKLKEIFLSGLIVPHDAKRSLYRVDKRDEMLAKEQTSGSILFVRFDHVRALLNTEVGILSSQQLRKDSADQEQLAV